LVFAGFANQGPALRARLQELGGTFWPSDSLPPSQTVAQAIACADPTDELRRAALWCREQLERNPQARLLVIDTRLDLRRAQAVQAFEHELHGRALLDQPGAALFGIEGGQQLTEFRIVQAALEVLALSGRGLEFRELSALLRSTYIGCGTLAQRASLELALRERNVASADFARLCELARHARSGGAALADALRAIAPFLASVPMRRDHGAGWAREFAGRLQAAGWPGTDSLGSEEQQQCERLQELLGELSTLGGSGALMSFAQALELLRAMAARTSFEPATPDVPVTLTEAIDDPLVAYDGIWVAGLNAESWPAPPRADPFVPIAVQRAAGFQPASAHGQLERAQQAMAAWRRCAGQLMLSWPESDADVPLQPSHLLGVPARARDAASIPPRADRLLAALQQQAHRERRPADPALPWPAGQRLSGGVKALQLQALCPFKAVGELRLGALPVAEPVPGLDRRERGQLLHRALELIYRRLKDSRELQRRANDSSLEALIAEASDQAMREQLDARTETLPGALASNERSRLAALIGKLLDQELVRARSAEFTIAALEESQERELGGLAVRVRMDRLDRLDDGRLIVLDYKSGAAETFRPLDERPRQAQLLAYALLASGAVAGVAAVHLGAEDIRWRGAAAEPALLPALGRLRAPSAPWPELMSHWRRVVDTLMHDFAAGVSTVDPLPGVCRVCQLPAFCRVDARRRNQTDPDAEDVAEASTDGG
jgi:probable DNA repair protein